MDTIINSVTQLTQGKYFVGNCTNKVETLLGSCVSVVLWHPKSKIGAISHSILDTRHNENNMTLDSKYCDEAVTIMTNELKLKGIKTEECEAKVFGGASLIPCIKILKIGEKNCKIALSIIEQYHIPIVISDILGKHHRKIIFDMNTGCVACQVH